MTLITAKEALAITIEAKEARKANRRRHAECCIKNVVEPMVLAEAEEGECTAILDRREFDGYQGVLDIVVEMLVTMGYIVALDERKMVLGW